MILNARKGTNTYINNKQQSYFFCFSFRYNLVEINCGSGEVPLPKNGPMRSGCKNHGDLNL